MSRITPVYDYRSVLLLRFYDSFLSVSRWGCDYLYIYCGRVAFGLATPDTVSEAVDDVQTVFNGGDVTKSPPAKVHSASTMRDRVCILLSELLHQRRFAVAILKYVFKRFFYMQLDFVNELKIYNF